MSVLIVYTVGGDVAATFPDHDLAAALDRLSPGWRRVPGLLERQTS